MRIEDAIPAPEYVKLPVSAIETLNKGELMTLARIARYLYGRQRPLEGTTADFVAVLGIDERTLQRRLPQLGQSGALRYAQPHRGYWTLHEIVFSTNGHGEAANEATVLSPPVVVHEQHNRGFLSLRSEQQQGNEATKLLGEQERAYEALRTLGIADAVATNLATNWDAEYILDIVAAAKRRGKSIKNPGGFVIKAITGEWVLPELKAKWFDGDGGSPYTSGEYAEYIQT